MTESNMSYKEAKAIKAARNLLTHWEAYQKTAGWLRRMPKPDGW